LTFHEGLGVERKAANEQANVSRGFRASLETVAKKMDHSGSDQGGSQQQPYDWNELLRQDGPVVKAEAKKIDADIAEDGDKVFYSPFPSGDAFVG
jgi:hypothetical protein